jgi:uncharacterized protein (TIGR02147 family)
VAAAEGVFAYTNYREFLAAYCSAAKRAEYGFSYRVFSKRAGCTSTNFPCLVIKGKRNLSAERALGFAAACRLSRSETAYFCELVRFNQAHGAREKEEAYGRMTQFAQFRRVQKLSEAQASYFSEWYVPVIRELAARADFQAEPAWIAAELVPAITRAQARRALEVLLELGLLERVGDRVRRTHELVTSGGPTGEHRQQLAAYHRTMLNRASEAIDLIPREEREIASLTLCVSQTKLLELKQQLRDFRQQLLQTAEVGAEAERVVQISFQLFPLSKARS